MATRVRDGHTGAATDRWRARVKREGTTHFLGAFDTKEEAIEAEEAFREANPPLKMGRPRTRVGTREKSRRGGRGLQHDASPWPKKRYDYFVEDSMQRMSDSIEADAIELADTKSHTADGWKHMITTRLCKTTLAYIKSHNELEWSQQGFGMLRHYISDTVRIHIWDLSLRTPDASDIHSHPWDLHSTVIKGRIRNIRYLALEGTPGAPLWSMATMRPGEDAALLTSPTPVSIRLDRTDDLNPHQSYRQKAKELHRTAFRSGTVTVCVRTNRTQEDAAIVIWRTATGWVPTTPHTADPDTVRRILQRI